jgi:hypothetical protein
LLMLLCARAAVDDMVDSFGSGSSPHAVVGWLYKEQFCKMFRKVSRTKFI